MISFIAFIGCSFMALVILFITYLFTAMFVVLQIAAKKGFWYGVFLKEQKKEMNENDDN